jgi:hypothetical protein
LNAPYSRMKLTLKPEGHSGWASRQNGRCL